jgi:arylsulfatase A-like enzyme
MRTRNAMLAAGVVTLASMGVLAWRLEAQGPAAPPRDIVLVVIDTLRVDHLSAYGYPRPTTPRLAALAAQGSRFDHAYAQSGWTLASFSSLLTGTYFHEHRVGRDSRRHDQVGCLTDDFETLPELLKGQGYSTAAFVNNTFLAPEFGLVQGFDRYDYAGATNQAHRSAKATVEAALSWMDAQPGPTFTLLHFMEPHLDYAPPPETAGAFTTGPRPDSLRMDGSDNPFSKLQLGAPPPEAAVQDYIRALYDEEILAADQGLGQLEDGLEARGRLAGALLAVTADHGEELWEQGGFEHGHALWSELTRVPLVLVGPGVPEGPVGTVVEHVDLFHTLALAAGALPRSTSHGADLREIPADQPGRTGLSENCLYGPPCLSITDGSRRLVYNPLDQLTSLWAVEGSHEVHRLEGAASEAALSDLGATLRARRGHLGVIDAAAPRSLSYDTFEKLAALGYMAEVEPQPGAAGGDPCARAPGR